ncbi:MAG: uroporphyrinogen-III C-methyltransferase [Planctomycetes bacterium]|nr:uroporphyrinogen-III C-methyltransferase [Planctomycetota bacterium]
MDQAAPTGQVVLIGGGPGDAQLLTLEALHWIRRADALVVDRLAPRQVLQWAPPGVECIDAGKDPSGRRADQGWINETMIALAARGKLVVRVKGGDPLVFGRGAEEAAALRAAGIPYRIVPGITAAVAAAAAAEIPLTDRRCAASVALVTGREDPAREATRIDDAALAGMDTVVVYMGVGALPSITARLLAAGKPSATPAAIVERTGLPGERIVRGTLETIAGQAEREGVGAPALLIVGEVVALAPEVPWRRRLPLGGATVLVTRAATQASGLVGPLRELGAAVVEAPTLAIEPIDTCGALDAAIDAIGTYAWLAFTSANGVEAVFGRLAARGLDARILAPVRIAAVGSATAEALAGRSIRADLVASPHTGEALAAAMIAAGDVRGRRVLLARADRATAALPEALRAAGATVDDAAVYRTARPAALDEAAAEALREGRVDWITFTSRSTVENLLALADRAWLTGGVRLASIGPVTSAALAEAGLTPAVEADPHTIDGLVRAIAAAWGGGHGA